MSATLISMDAVKAVVAEQVTTYNREDVEKGILEFGRQLQEAKANVATLEYQLELYQALKVAFDRDYPLGPLDDAFVPEEVAAPIENTEEPVAVSNDEALSEVVTTEAAVDVAVAAQDDVTEAEVKDAE